MESNSSDVRCRCKKDGPVEATGTQRHGSPVDQGTENRATSASGAAAHILVFPFPAQGHINSMLRLSELLCLSGIKHITFINTHRNHCSLMANNRHTSRSHRPHPGIQFRSISDGFPEDDNEEGRSRESRVWELHGSLAEVVPPQLLAILGDRRSNNVCDVYGDQLRVGDHEVLPPVTCAIVDGFLSFAIDVCLEAAVPVVAFRTISACGLWVYNSIPDLIQAGELPFAADADGFGLDEPIRSIPGMEAGLLRRRDLPKVARVKDLKDDPVLPILHTETRRTWRATAVLLNTFEAMESSVLSLIRSQIPRTFAVGPTHALLPQLQSNRPLEPISDATSRHSQPKAVDEKAAGSSHASSVRMSLWEEDPSCITWLDEQPHKSVVYVSFGSFTVMTKEQVLEFWHGLLASGQRFLWVLRPDLLVDFPARELAGNRGSKTVHGTTVIPPLENGKLGSQCLLVNWAPQEEVLNHPSVGGFFTHCGWNSVLETVVAGVPMLCWPFFADQQVNSRFVEHVWKVGIDIKDICDSDKVAGAVRDLMQGPKAKELRAAATKLAEAAKVAVSPGGSSYSDFQELVQCIKLADFSR